MGNAPSRRSLAAALLIGVCAACGTATPTPTLPPPSVAPTSTLSLSTHAGPVVRETLPPTWTPTATLTLAPPTATLTPTPVTPTGTATPVPSLADVCASLTVNYAYPDGYSYSWNDVVTMIFGTPYTSALDPATGSTVALMVRFLATQISSGQNLGVQLVGGQVFAMQLPVNQLPGPGAFTWEVAVYGDGIDGSCAHQGTFFVTQSADDLLTSTALIATELAPTATSTAEATEDGIFEIQ